MTVTDTAGASDTQTLTITVTGRNDSPTVTGTVVLSPGKEDTPVTIHSAVLLAQASDIDQGETGQLHVQHLQADHGSVVDNQDGTFTFTPDANYNGPVRFSYDIADPHGSYVSHSATLSLGAVADAAVIGGDDKGTVQEDVISGSGSSAYALRTSGQLTIQDPDTGEAEFEEHYAPLGFGSDTTLHGLYGNLRLFSDGSWDYAGNNAHPDVQGLGAGATPLTDVFVVHSVDGTPHTITISIAGTNDVPVLLHSISTQQVDEDAQLQFTLPPDTFADIDHGDNLTLTASGLPGWLHFDAATGTFSGTPSNQDVGSVPVTVTATDSQGASVTTQFTLTVNNTNDAPVLTPIASVQVAEDGKVVQGQLQASDADQGDQLHFSSGKVEGFSLNSDGSWSFDPSHSAYQHLAVGQSQTLNIPVTVTDNAGASDTQTIVITVTGTNDIPTLTLHAQNQMSGSLMSGDVDSADTHTFGVTQAAGAFGDLSLDPQTGQYIYTAHQTVTGMNYNPASHSYSATDTFEVQVSDHHGGVVTKYLTFDVNGMVSSPGTPGQQPGIQTQVVQPAILNEHSPVPIQPSVLSGSSNPVTLTLLTSSDTGVSDHDRLTNDVTPDISGTTAIPFSQVIISEGGRQIATTYSDGNGHYELTLPPLTDSVHYLVATATDPAGISSSQSSVLDLEIDTTPPPASVTLDSLTPDDVLNLNELGSQVTLGGTVSGDILPGSQVDIEVGKTTYHAVVDDQHRFSVAVPGTQLAADNQITATVSAQDRAGNQVIATDVHHYQVDASADIRIDTIAGDNILDPGEQQQPLVISGSVTGVEDGQVVHVSVAGHDFRATVVNQQWSTTLDSADVQALPGGVSSIIATVADSAGNHASSTSPLFVPDGLNPVPALSFKTPPLPTGGGGIGSHISGDLVVPPLLQQLLPPQTGSGGWAISDGHGHTVTSLQGDYGTLTIDPDTGHVEYVYHQAPVAGDKTAGGIHWAGQTSSEQHHDVFKIVYHDIHSSNVDVKVNLDVTYIHGHSGHNQESTQLVDMTVSPVSDANSAPASQHDEALVDDTSVESFTIEAIEPDAAHQDIVDPMFDADNNHLVYVNEDSSRPVDHYLSMVGLTASDVEAVTDASHDPYLSVLAPAVDDPLSLTPDTPNGADNLDDPLFSQHAHEKAEEHKLDNPDEHGQASSDDDLLHSGLNDMHNQL